MAPAEQVPLGPDGKPEKQSYLLKLKADAAFDKAVEAQDAVGGQTGVFEDGKMRMEEPCEAARPYLLEVVEILSEAIELSPWTGALYFERSAALARLGRMEEAAEDHKLWEFAIESWPYDSIRYMDSAWKPPTEEPKPFSYEGTTPHFSQRVPS